MATWVVGSLRPTRTRDDAWHILVGKIGSGGSEKLADQDFTPAFDWVHPRERLPGTDSEVTGLQSRRLRPGILSLANARSWMPFPQTIGPS